MIQKHRRTRKIMFGTMYALFLVAGVLAFINPSRAIEDALQLMASYLWATFLALGSGLALMSLLRGKWGGELIGLPLLSAANFVFGAALWGYGDTPLALAVGCAFWAIGFGLLGRWFEVRQWIRLAREVNGGTP